VTVDKEKLDSLVIAVASLEKSHEHLEKALEKNSADMVKTFDKVAEGMKEMARGVSTLAQSMTERVIIDDVADKRMNSLEQENIDLRKRLSIVEKIAALTDNFRQSFSKVVLPLIGTLIGIVMISALAFKFSAGG